MTFRPVLARMPSSAKGLSTWTPASSKSLTLRVTTVMPVYPRRCRDERVNHREGLRVLLTAPGSSDREGDRENPVFEPGLHVPEPALKGGGLMPVSPAADSRNPLLDLAQGQHGDMQPVRRRGRDPAGYPRRWLALARLRQHISVKQVSHMPASMSTIRPKSALRSASISAKTSAASPSA